MTWIVTFKKSAKKELEELPDSVLARVDKTIAILRDDPYSAVIKKLKGLDSYRIRIGTHRIILTINSKEKVVDVIAIRHRREVYRRRGK